MIQLNNYILEKLNLNSNNKNLNTFDAEEANKRVLQDALEGVNNFLMRIKDIDQEDFDIKLNNKNEICIHFYIRGKGWYKQLEDKFFDDGFGKKSWFSEIFLTNYGLRIRPNFYIN